MNTKYIIILFSFLVLLSCKDRNRENISSILQEWEHREILFPNKMLFSVQGKDTVDYSFDGVFKILHYSDSIGCTNCKLKLHDWTNFMFEIDSLSDSSQVQFLFFFTPKVRNEMCHILSYNNFTHPVCIDEQDSINLINHFPTDAMFQTFLLDSANKVMAMGNPINNPKVKELYLSIILGKTLLSSASEQSLAIVSFSRSKIDLGDFSWDEAQEVEFVVSNTGKVPLVINDVITSCGCTTVEYSKEPVQKGKNLTLKVKYKADHPEHFNKTITVYCNTKDSPLQLKISGNAK